MELKEKTIEDSSKSFVDKFKWEGMSEEGYKQANTALADYNKKMCDEIDFSEAGNGFPRIILGDIEFMVLPYHRIKHFATDHGTAGTIGFGSGKYLLKECTLMPAICDPECNFAIAPAQKKIEEK
ncbi:MAG: hypothetical protein M0P61_00325 [Ignavibacteriaceae bacterium]|jgi:hypothetical protein|nr:hypothetical protein [Ignavibacteriaceae bacterium]